MFVPAENSLDADNNSGWPRFANERGGHLNRVIVYAMPSIIAINFLENLPVARPQQLHANRPGKNCITRLHVYLRFWICTSVFGLANFLPSSTKRLNET
jgi:hypothetical protein